MPPDLFTLYRPSPQVRSLPIVANLPHSGLAVPDAIALQFTPEHLSSLPNSDWHLQSLYSFLPDLGITVMQANYSRYVVDLNRALNPPFFGSFWSAVVPEQTAFKQPIYREPIYREPVYREPESQKDGEQEKSQKPSPEEVRSRINNYYTPYHQQLATLLNETVSQHGKVYLLDLHSFMGLITDDVCLGNANGKTCSTALIEAVNDSFSQQGYQVVNNKVFTGGYITRHYGQQPQVEALQIELRYPVYLPHDQLEKPHIPQGQGSTFDQAQIKLRTVFQQIADSISSLAVH